MNNKPFILFMIILLGLSCTKEHDIINIEEEPFELVSNIEVSTFLISINDDIPFSCIINDEEYFSDSSGILLLKNLLLDKSGCTVVLKSEGYYDEVRYVIPGLGAHLYMEMAFTEINESVYPSKKLGQFSAAEGGVISDWYIEIDIEPNTIVDASGNLFEGDVNVIGNDIFTGAYVNRIRTFPHNLFRENGNNKILNIGGGLNMVLLDEMNNRLYLKEDAKCKIKFKLQSSELVALPELVELMHFDIENNTWVSMGKAEKEGENWYGTINDLGIIVWGVKHQSRLAEINLLTDNGIPVSNKMVWLFVDLGTPANMAFSDGDGVIRIQIPIGTEFELSTIEMVTTPLFIKKEYETVGSGEGNVIKLDDFILTSEGYKVHNGSVVDCNGQIIKESAVITPGPPELGYSFYNSYVFSDEEGAFNFAYPINREDFIDFRGFDLSNNATSDVYSISNENEDTVEFGNLVVCE